MKKIKRLILATSLIFGTIRADAASDTSISALPAITSVTATTILPVVDTSGTATTKKATVAQLIDGLPAATGSVPGTMSAADKTKLDAAATTATASTLMLRDGSGNAAINTLTAALVTGLSAPTNPSDAANKGYVDAAAAGLIIKTPCRAATISANITLSGGAPSTLDGVTLAANDRVLVKNQSAGTENGIYYVATLGSGSNGTWTRTTDADTGAKLVTGSYVFITGGTVNANAAYTMVTPGTITLGTSTITWNLFSQVTQIQASNIIGQIVGSQVQDAIINTAKFAAGLRPVEIVGTLPTTGNTVGRTVFLTTDGKLYRYDGSAFTAAVPSTDLTGQITSTQITDSSITSPKINAGAVVAGKIAANAVTAGTIAANAVVAGTIQAGAVNTSELAAGAVNASKIAAGTITADRLVANTITAGQIAAGTITADRLTISSLSAISANIGTITAGSITSSATISVGSGTTAVNISSSTFSVGAVHIEDFAGTGTLVESRTGNHHASLYSATGVAEISTTDQGTGKFATLLSTGQIKTNYRVETPLVTGSAVSGYTPGLDSGGNVLRFKYDGGVDAVTARVDTTDFILVRAGDYTSSLGATAGGYVQMKDSSGTVRNFLVQ